MTTDAQRQTITRLEEYLRETQNFDQADVQNLLVEKCPALLANVQGVRRFHQPPDLPCQFWYSGIQAIALTLVLDHDIILEEDGRPRRGPDA